MQSPFSKVVLNLLVVLGLLVVISISPVMLTARSTMENIVGFLLTIGGILGAIIAFNKINRSVLGIVVLCTALPLLSSCGYERIDAGHVGLQIDLYGSEKGVQDVTLVTGAVWYQPLTTTVEEFPTFTQTKDYEPFMVNAKDASEFTVDPTLSYYAYSDSVVSIYKQYRRPLDELEDGILRNMVYDAYRITTNKFTSDELMSNRSKYEQMIEEDLKVRMGNAGFCFQQLTSQIVPPQSLKLAIDAKNMAIQEALQVENQIKREKAQAEIAITKANGVAQSQLISAKAEAEAYRMKQQTLTPLLVQQQFLDKWNGVLPVYGAPPQLFKDITR